MTMNSSITTSSESYEKSAPQCIAKNLGPEKRKELAIETLAGNTPVSRLASDTGVSRQFLYENAKVVEDALDNAFEPTKKDDEVLFYFPITKTFLTQMILALVLLCHSSPRRDRYFMRDILDVSVSPATVHNIVHEAVHQAQKINESQDLSGIKAAAHDELYQGHLPVLAGIDLDSNYCYLLTNAEHRDADTWAIYLLTCELQGLHPDYTVAEAGQGLRAGQALVWDDVPCFGDNFHIIQEFTKITRTLERRAYSCIAEQEKLEQKMAKAKTKGQGNKLSRKLAQARLATNQAIRVADDVHTLRTWMRDDIRAKAGPDAATRMMLYDFVTENLLELTTLDPKRIGALRRRLENQRDQVLAFAYRLDEGIASIGQRFGICDYLVRETLKLHAMNLVSQAYYKHEKALYQQLHGYLYHLREALDELLKSSHRSSSMVENFNGRLRDYFFLRRQVGEQYLELLRFFLNHHPFMRSKHIEQVGKSPVELMTGKKHLHWLELLGFKRFKRTEQAA